jgi:hypothetical protein
MACENCGHSEKLHHGITSTFDVCDGKGRYGGLCPCDCYSEDYAEEIAKEALDGDK